MSWIKSHPRLVFCLTSILFLLVFAEFILRLAGIGYGNSPIEVNQRLHIYIPRITNLPHIILQENTRDIRFIMMSLVIGLAQKIFLIQMTLIVELLFWEMVSLKPIQ